MNYIKAINHRAFIVAIIHFLVTTFFDALVFTYDDLYSKNIYIILKVIVFFILIGFWNFVFSFFKRIREKDKVLIKKAKIFGIYFGLMLILLVIIWPGVWVWDEFGIYEYAISLNHYYWQHYFSSAYFILALMIFPFAGGIVLFQIILISLITTYILYDLSLKYKRYNYLYFILLLPPILLYNFDPIRVTMYSYILLFVLYYLYFKLYKATTLTFRSILPVILLAPFVVVWRSEGVLFLPFIIVLLFLVSRNKIKTSKLIGAVLLILAFSISLHNPQKIWAKHNKDYALTAMLNPLSMMLQVPHLHKMNELKADLSGLINLEVLKNMADIRETPAFWNKKDELIISTKEEDFDKFKTAYFKLVMANFQLFLEVRTETFWCGSGMSNDIARRWRSAAYDLNKREDYTIQIFKGNSFLNKANNTTARLAVLNLMEGSDPRNQDETLWYYHFTWNLGIMYCLLLITTIVSVLRKDVPFLIVCIMLWASSFAIFLTAPASYFMYYLPIYLTTYVLSFCYLLDIKLVGWRRN